MAWFDPDEMDPDQWREVSEVRRGDEIRSTYERAVAVDLPYDRRVELRGADEMVAEAFPAGDYDFIRLQCYGTVDTDARLKLNERGLVWGEDEHQRYRRQYRRPAEPTDTEPFDGYTVWERTQRGEVTREGNSLSFEGSDDPSDEEVNTLAWEECTEFQRIVLAELELVRNPPYARHCLEERDEWEVTDDAFRYLTHAFDSPP